MGREIKFRIWSKDCNMWVNNEEEPHCADYRSDLYIVNQFTGLKDKKGVEIYENDLVFVSGNGEGYCTPNEDGVYIVRHTNNEYDIKVGWFLAKTLKQNYENGYLVMCDVRFLQKIGNIHENKKSL